MHYPRDIQLYSISDDLMRLKACAPGAMCMMLHCVSDKGCQGELSSEISTIFQSYGILISRSYPETNFSSILLNCVKSTVFNF